MCVGSTCTRTTQQHNLTRNHRLINAHLKETWYQSLSRCFMMTVRQVLRTLSEMKTILMSLIVPVLLLPILFCVEGDSGRCAYAVAILIVFWVFEVLPLPVTSLLPPLLFPVLGVLTAREVCGEYIKEASITVMGIFGIVAAIERWGLHRRMGLGILMLFGTKPHWLILGVLVCTSVLSMIITAGVAVLMLPIVRTMVEKIKNVESVEASDIELQNVGKDGEIKDEGPDPTENTTNAEHEAEIARLYKALALCIAYGTSLGSTATLTGSPVNFIMVGLTEEFYRNYGLNSKVTFISWLIFACPIAVIVVFLTWVWFVIFFLRGKGLFRRHTVTEEMAKVEKRVKEHLKEEYKSLGPWSYPEIVVLLALVLLVVLFVTEDLYFVPGWDSLFKKGYVASSAPACLLVALLFIIPAKSPRALLSHKSKDDTGSKFAPILRWSDVSNSLPWGILLLVGAAFTLVKASQKSGMTAVIGTYFQTFVQLEPWVLTLVITSLTTFLTEFISNAATLTMLLPIVGQVAILANLDPLALIFPMTLAAKFAFMMPIATPPNAIAYSLGALQIKDMAAAGFVLNLLTLLTLNIASHTWGKAYFRWDIVPEEMKLNSSIVGDLS